MLLRVPRVRQDGTVVTVQPVITASTVPETTMTALYVTIALQGGIRTQWGKEVVCRVFLDCTKIASQKVIANNALKGNFQMQLN